MNKIKKENIGFPTDTILDDGRFSPVQTTYQKRYPK
jgi:hypothetical protein